MIGKKARFGDLRQFFCGLSHPKLPGFITRDLRLANFKLSSYSGLKNSPLTPSGDDGPAFNLQIFNGLTILKWEAKGLLITNL